MSNLKKGGQTDLFKDLSQSLNPKESDEELQKLADFLGEQQSKLVGIISPKQLSAESKSQFESSGQGATLRAAALKALRDYQPLACYEIEELIGREIQHTGILVELKKSGLIGVSEERIKVNPHTGRRVGIYYLLRQDKLSKAIGGVSEVPKFL